MMMNDWVQRQKRCIAPITPFPIPLTTPPETRMYFVMAAVRGQADERLAKDLQGRVRNFERYLTNKYKLFALPLS